MWFFDWFYNQFWNLRTYFQNLGDTLNRVPALGGYFASPFWWIASFFWNLSTAAQTASSWSDSIASTASAAYSNALNACTYAYGWLTTKVTDAWNKAVSAYNYASNTVWNYANTAWLKAQDAYNYTSGWISTTWNSFVSDFWKQIDNFTTWKNGFVSDFWSRINAIETWKNETLSKIPTSLNVIDWVEASLEYLTGKAIIRVTANASSFAYLLWQCTDAIVGKLTEWEGK